jgi:hypothetical protein
VRNPDEPGFILDLKPEVWGDPGDSQTCLGVFSVTYFSHETVLGDGKWPPDHVLLVGESREIPVRFVELAANRFRSLDFEVHGTGDDEYFSRWEAQWSFLAEHPRKVECVEQRVTCHQSGEILELEIRGQRILPREDAEERN